MTEDELSWPLVIPDKVIDVQLHFCSMLQPLAHTTRVYFEAAGAFQSELDTFVAAMEPMEPVKKAIESTPGEMLIDQAVERAKASASSYANVGGAGCRKWKHPYYRADERPNPDYTDPDNDRMVRLPPSTWFAGAGVSDAAYRSRTALWENIMGGLGVPQGNGRFGQLGSLACSSIQVRADKVGKYPKVIRGWVNLVPVHIVKDKNDSLDLGICH